MGQLIRAITKDGAVLATAIDSTDMVRRAEQIHHSSATVTAAIGRLLTAASMMGAMMKNEADTVTVRICGGGPAGAITAVSDSSGNARVTVVNPVVELGLNDRGKLDVAGAVGHTGYLSVIRDAGVGTPQTGYSAIVSGEIGEDITAYFAQSEQIPTVCALGVLVNPDLTVAAAGGLLLQLLPGADDKVIDRLEQNIAVLPAVSTMVQEGMSPEQMLARALDGFEIEPMEQCVAHYRCTCSRERVERVLHSFGSEELHRLAAEESVVSVECHFCEKVYDFTPDQLLGLIPKKDQ